MARAYLRFDPRLFEKKVVEQGYPLPLFAAFVGTICEAEHQPVRGSFRNDRVLRALLGPAARFVPELIARGDLVSHQGGSLTVDGWEQWQEGDMPVPTRLAAIRNRARAEGRALTGAERTALWRAHQRPKPRDAESDERHTVTPPAARRRDERHGDELSDGGRLSVIDSDGVSDSEDSRERQQRTGRAASDAATEPGSFESAISGIRR